MFISQKLYEVEPIYEAWRRKETKDDLLIGIILVAMTILAIGIILLHSNDPVYPQSRLSGSKNMIDKAGSSCAN